MPEIPVTPELLTTDTPTLIWDALVRGPRRDWPDGWHRWPAVQEAHRRLVREFIQGLPATAPATAPATGQGDGIVIAGGGRYWAGTYVTVRLLRHLGCTLPVQVWYFGHAQEMPPAKQALLAPYGVECVDADQVQHRHPLRSWGGWELKPFAVQYSPFRRVLYLDADCYPATDPTDLFAHPDFQKCGAVFFPDCRPERLPPWTWAAFGLPYQDEPAFESGQFLLDKARCGRELLLTLHLVEHSDYYFQWHGNDDPHRFLYGDKDCFHMAWWLLGTPYALWWQEPEVLADSYLHYDDQKRLRFIHRCRNKFLLNGEQHTFPTPQPHPQTRRTPELPLEDVAFGFLDELASLERTPATPAWRPSRRVRLCVPTLCCYQSLQTLLTGARRGTLPPDAVTVIDNGGSCPTLEGVELIRPGKNLGVAASWNRFLAQAGPDEYLVIANDDVTLRQDTLERLCRAADVDPDGLVFVGADAGLYAWSLFLMKPEIKGRVGLFDEECWPAYFEDNDLEYRLRLAKCPPIQVPGVQFGHQPGSTTAQLPEEVRLTHQHHHAWVQGYYERKWGGPPRAEVFTTPFNQGATSWEWVPGAFDGFAGLYDEAVAQARSGATLVEVGCYRGRSLCYLGQQVRESGKPLLVVGVEHGKGSQDGSTLAEEARQAGGTYLPALRQNLTTCGLDATVTLLPVDSVTAAARFRPDSLDFVFIDGCHAEASVRADLAAWWPKLRSGGLLAGHDYHYARYPDVTRAVDAFFAAQVQARGHCWLVRKGNVYTLPVLTREPARHLTFYVVRRGTLRWAALAEQMIRAYCTRWGHDLVIADTGGRGRHAAWAKLLAFETLTADHLVLLDLDVLPLPWAGDLSAVLDFNRPALVRETEAGCREHARAWHLDPAGQRYNTGLVALSRSLAPVLADAYAYGASHHPDGHRLHEQGPLNDALWRSGVAVQELPRNWNGLVNSEMHAGRWVREEDYLLDTDFAHAGGGAATGPGEEGREVLVARLAELAARLAPGRT